MSYVPGVGASSQEKLSSTKPEEPGSGGREQNADDKANEQADVEQADAGDTSTDPAPPKSAK